MRDINPLDRIFGVGARKYPETSSRKARALLTAGVGEKMAWRVLHCQPRTEEGIESVTQCRDWIRFEEYLDKRRRGCGPDELGWLCSLSFKLTQAILSRIKNEESNMETDLARRQEIKNSIAEGESILKSGLTSAGRKMLSAQLDAVRRSVNNAKRKLDGENHADASPSAKRGRRKRKENNEQCNLGLF